MSVIRRLKRPLLGILMERHIPCCLQAIWNMGQRDLMLSNKVYLTQHGLKWEYCVGVCADGAKTMTGKRRGLQGLIKRVLSNG